MESAAITLAGVLGPGTADRRSGVDDLICLKSTPAPRTGPSRSSNPHACRSFSSVSVLGTCWLRSMRAIADWGTPDLWESSRCEKPAARLAWFRYTAALTAR
jgi:hypothetical protein